MLRLRLLALGLALAALIPSSALAQAPADDPSTPLVYVFVPDGLDGDRVDQGVAPFLNRLLLGQEDNAATYYQESRGLMVAETNPNHVAITTGAFGDKSGVPGNAFAVYSEEAKRDCVGETGQSEDPPDVPQDDAESTGEVEQTDGERTGCLLAESVFEAAKRQPGADRITTAGIFGKPKLAQILSTQRVDPRAYDADYLWTPCESPSDDTPFCKQVPINPATRYAADDSIVMDEVLRTVREGVPADGTTKRPNLTVVNFPQIDSAGHATGAGAVYDEAIGMIDAQLARFVAQQKALGLWNRTILFAVSDHSLDTTLMRQSVRAQFALAGLDDDLLVVQNGSVDMVYLKERGRPDAAAILKQAREVALRTPGVDEALYRLPNAADGGAANTLDAVHPGWRIAGPRTGDLFVTQLTGGAFNEPNPLTGNHGGPQTTDNTFVVIGGGGQVRQQSLADDRGPRFDDTLQNPGQAQNVDVAPTVMALFGRQAPRNNEGRVLTEAFAPGFLERAAQGNGGDGSGGSAGQPCAVASAFRSVSVRPRQRGLRVRLSRAAAGRATVEVFRQSRGGRIVQTRRVARFRSRGRTVTWSGRGAGPGFYAVRVSSAGAGNRTDRRTFVARRRGERFVIRRGFVRRPSCGLLRKFKLNRSVFGGTSSRPRPLRLSYRLARPSRVSITLLRGGRVLRRFATRPRVANRTHRVKVRWERVRSRGDVTVRIVVRSGQSRVVERLYAKRL